MPQEHIWSLYEIIKIVIGILVVVGLIVLDIVFCNYFKGFCVFRWTLQYLGSAVYSSVSNPFAKLFILGLMRGIDLIPL